MTQRITINTPINYQDELPDTADIAIIGGGVIGIFSALYLARLGKKILLCEKGRIAGEQSSRNWGWIRQHGRDAAELPIASHAVRLWQEVNQETNGQCGVHRFGTMYLATTEQSLTENAAWLEIAKAHGLDTRSLSTKEVNQHFSDANDGRWLGATFTPSDCRGEPWQAVPAVAKLAHEAGVLIRENCAVRALETSAGHITGIHTEHGPVECEQVVLAGGAWSSLFARKHGVNIPQLSVRATVAQTEPLPEFFSGNAADEKLAIRRREDGAYSLALCDRHTFYPGPDAFRNIRHYLPVLKRDWQSLDAGLAAPKGFPDSWGIKRNWHADEITPFENIRVLEPKPDAKNLPLMQQRFAERFPTHGKPKLQNSWAGMIDAMPDAVPIVDYAPEIAGLLIATGMSGHGFGIGPGYGDIIAQMLTGKTPEFNMTRFRFGRFTDGSKLVPGPGL